MIIDVPLYNKEEGVVINWKENFQIKTNYSDQTIVITGNRAGLESLASQILTLAQDNIEAGTHIHYDDGNSLEEGSVDLVIEKA